MNIQQFFLKFKQSKAALYAIFALVILGLSWALSVVLPPAVDWHTAFRPAAIKLISGQSPYDVEGFFNPFWTLIPLIPIAIFPEPMSRGILFVVTLLSLTYIAHKLGAKLWAIFILLLSPPAMHGLLNGNIDWLVLYGLVLPPWLGLFFVTMKPQIGAAIAVFWVIEAWRDGGWQKALQVVGPFAIVFFLSLLIFGLWPLRSGKEIDLWWNASLWPTSIPIGLALLTTALRKRNIKYAMGASPCLSPYVLFHSWIIGLFAIVDLLPELLLTVIGLWILVIIRATQ